MLTPDKLGELRGLEKGLDDTVTTANQTRNFLQDIGVRGREAKTLVECIAWVESIAEHALADLIKVRQQLNPTPQQEEAPKKKRKLFG